MWKFAHVDLELKSKGLEFCHIEIESIGLTFVLLQELIRDFAFLFFLFLLSPDLSSFRPTLHFQAPKNHEQNQTQNPKKIPNQIKSSPMALLLL